MSTTPSVEDLLRRTFAEVAERTSVTRDGAGTPEPRLTPGRPRPSGRLLAAAAVVVLVVGGLAVLSQRDADRPAGRGTPTRVVPGWVPRPTTPSGFFTPYALTELTSTAERDVVTYSAAAGSITVTLDRTTSSLPDGTPTQLRGAEARRSATSFAWVGPGGDVIEVSWSGDVTDSMAASFVQGIAEVDEATWDELVGAGGFRENAYEPLATIEIDADASFEAMLMGDLHQGLSLWIGSGGYPLGSIDRCAASVNDETSDWESDVTGYTVLAPGHVTSAVIRPIGNDDRVVEMTSLLPFADVSIGGAVYEDRSPTSRLPQVDCEVGS